MNKVIPITYVDIRSRQVRTDYVKQQSKYDFKPDKDYHPTHISGACSVCHVIGNLEFPNGFDYKTGDNVMERRRIKVMCLRCRKETEFIPLKIGDQETVEGLRWLKKIEQKMQQELVAAKA